ncbi:MAG: hypothetical protein VYE59_05525 [Candidatus Thermoplasmatota archaeon]|nr:hypothetical protein [Candidatus Thermoplasmatota archaeon]MED5486059.1 hypothetical protein [Candidatus Thermoplasmatota archaeon]MEE3134889.1 hypothetical protein [Candidatus Thermoplasmatota archaeon]
MEDEEDIQLIKISDTVYATKEELEKSEQAAEMLQTIQETLSPVRLLAASLVVLLLLSSVFATYYWVIPRDAVNVEVIYMQSGGGHVILAEVHNVGSRGISEVSVEISFEDQEGNELNNTIFYREEIGAHISVASNDLELTVPGATVWDNYEIKITINYKDGKNNQRSKTWTHPVGDYVYDWFTNKVTRHWLII